MKYLFAVLIITLMAGCTAPIRGPETITATGAPVAGGGIPITNPTVVTDLQDAAYNFDNAVLVGALPATDPAPKCIHGILQQAGIEVPAGVSAAKSFTPKNGGAISAGSIAYIQAQQLKATLGQGVVVPQDCKALIGSVVIDGLTAVNKVGAAVILKGLIP